jgi:hypothetical protein
MYEMVGHCCCIALIASVCVFIGMDAYGMLFLLIDISLGSKYDFLVTSQAT